MQPPPVQYVATSDGFNIAFTECGQGGPVVFLPWPVSHLILMWRSEWGRPFLEALAGRFRLVKYDSRGQGMSARGLPENHSLNDYLLDLEAVVDRLALDRFVLYGGPLFSHVAVRYAVQRPERVEALVLNNASMGHAWDNPLAIGDLARRDWELFLHTFASSFGIGPPIDVSFCRESQNQADYLSMMRAAEKSSIEALLPSLKVPTLVMAPRRLTQDGALTAAAAAAQSMARMIPNARLVLFDVYGTYYFPEDGRQPAMVTAIEQFVAGLAPPDKQPARPSGAMSSGLSPRELEVLRLIASGRSNQQIADELVLSVRTVERHITNLYAKIGAHGKADATAYALRSGLS